MFSTLKYVNAPNFEKFREHWKAHYLGGFVVHSKAFDGISGNFPIGFLVWDASVSEPIGSITTKALDKDGDYLGGKMFFNIPPSRYLNLWISRLKTDAQNVPLKNAVHPQNHHAKVTS